jgi:cell division protein FtsB
MDFDWMDFDWIFKIVLNLAMVAMLVYSIILRIRTRKILSHLKKQQEDRDLGHKIFMENLTGRVNLLSRENAKLIDENETLKERLRNMGIKDFDIM